MTTQKSIPLKVRAATHLNRHIRKDKKEEGHHEGRGMFPFPPDGVLVASYFGVLVEGDLLGEKPRSLANSITWRTLSSFGPQTLVRRDFLSDT